MNKLSPANAPVSFRLAGGDLAVIDRAARLRGRSRTDFVRAAALREAEQAVLDATVIRLDAADFAAFERHLKSPGTPNAALRDLMRRPAPWGLDVEPER